MKMKTIINIKEKESAIENVDVFRKKKYENKDIRFSNTDLKKLNEKIRLNLFNKNDLFISSETLWELMQDEGGSGSHNYHGLTAEDIVTALNSITDPFAIIDNKTNRYAIITTTLSHFDEPLMIVIEIGSGLVINKNANINKIVTMYPRSDVETMIEKIIGKKIYYKKMSINTGQQ